MIDLTGVSHHHALEEVTDVLCSQTQNNDRFFFRPVAAYFLNIMASNMRAVIATKDRGDLPVNAYALCLSPSGTGKGHSINIMEGQLLNKFRRRFTEETFTTISDHKLHAMATERAARDGTNPEEERVKLDKEFRESGSLRFTFDSATVPALKQFRHKLLMAGIGSINLSIDEIGSNLKESVELLNTFLELFDQGLVKDKLTKNTHENVRTEELEGKTPANLLMFGTPSKLLDGGYIEDTFHSFLETGYGRRCIFSWGTSAEKSFEGMTPEQAYYALTSQQNNMDVDKWSSYFEGLADPVKYGWRMEVPDEVGIKIMEYKFACEKFASTLPEHEEIRKAEVSHRYFKALKLAGAYAFIDHSVEVTMDHFLSAVLLIQESGEAFNRILNREKAYVKLAKYIATVGTDVTHADLNQALPFYKSSVSARNELMSLAIAWGHKQHIIIKKSFVDGIDFFSGERLKETDLDAIRVSYSDDFAYNYIGEEVPFTELHTLITAKDFHFVNHYLKNGHRAEENVRDGFNMIVLDIDGTVSMALVQELLKDYTYMLYTTKSHSEEEERFRVVMPINYFLELDTEDYRQFVDSLLAWLPFECDEVTNQRARKWRTNDQAEIIYNDGILLDALRFIPRTTRNEQHSTEMAKIESMDNLERWFAQRISTGNRNKQMIKYAFALADSGLSFDEVTGQVKRFNKMIPNSLSHDELASTILRTISKRYAN